MKCVQPKFFRISACQAASRGPCHAHGERQQAQHRRLLGIVRQQVLVAAHAREVIHIAGLRHADDRVDQQVGLGFPGRAKGEFLVRAVHRVARLKRDHAPPAEFPEALAQLPRVVAQVLEVIVRRRFDAPEASAEVDAVRAIEQVIDARMRVVDRAEHGACFAFEVGTEDARKLHRGDQDALGVAQRDRVAFPERRRELLVHVERDRDRPEHAAGKPHVGQYAVVVGFTEKAVERGERAVEQQFEVAKLTHRQVPRRQIARARLLRGGFARRQIAVLQLPSMGFLERSHIRSRFSG